MLTAPTLWKPPVAPLTLIVRVVVFVSPPSSVTRRVAV